MGRTGRINPRRNVRRGDMQKWSNRDCHRRRGYEDGQENRVMKLPMGYEGPNDQEESGDL